ncbi:MULTISPECIES: P-type conjugative transfer protein TrbL [Sphingomonadales]|uniref:P-type conjugative transfer protein TrbL n=1 Tax=Sphingomonadales TaxID=204457 RepID=UPI000B5A7296|nr:MULTISPECIES: P-type conjugative transfer protein TrbL [Sphingomonadales]ASJ91099.1 P-type conjugative transfer protein TrbL [Porphyrobacter sp. CACIAM 03H1]WRD77755.1 P-type conjugative transfer protein TrbL [Sphingobium baderi]
MNDTGVIDNFLEVFTTYIDSGFGLLGGEIAFLSTTLIAIDLTIAGLFWAWGADEDVLQRLIKKTLYIGVFAFIIGNFSTLATIVFQSFAGLGLKATGDSMSIADFMRPGFIAATGLDAGEPLVVAAGELVGPISFFTNFVQIVVLLLAWALVVIAFFILAIQIFVTLIEFKLVTLAGFVLLPFAFFNKTAFMAEKVLGHVVSTGIKVLVLAVITGIGTTLFSQFTAAAGPEPTLEQAMSIALGALSLLGLAIFGPGVANGIVSGGPALGAGAAAGTALAAGGALVGGAAAARLGAGAAAGAIGGAARGSAFASGAASSAYALGSAGKTGASAVAGGAVGVGQAAAGAAMSPLRKAAASLKDSYRSGGRAAVTATGGTISGGASPSAPVSDDRPAWASAMKRRQTMTHGATIAAHTLRSGDGGGSGSSVDLHQKD